MKKTFYIFYMGVPYKLEFIAAVLLSYRCGSPTSGWAKSRIRPTGPIFNPLKPRYLKFLPLSTSTSTRSTRAVITSDSTAYAQIKRPHPWRDLLAAIRGDLLIASRTLYCKPWTQWLRDNSSILIHSCLLILSPAGTMSMSDPVETPVRGRSDVVPRPTLMPEATMTGPTTARDRESLLA